MEGDDEFEMLLEEIPQATSLNPQHLQQQHHHGYVQVHAGHGSSSTNMIQPVHGMCFDDPSRNHEGSTADGVTIQSEVSSWSSFSGAFSSSDYEFPSSPFFQETKSLSPLMNTNYPNELLFDSQSPDDSPAAKNAILNLRDEMGLSNDLRRMRIGDEQEDRQGLQGFVAYSHGFRHCDYFPPNANYYNGENNDQLAQCGKCFTDQKGLHSSVATASINLKRETMPVFLESQQRIRPMGSFLSGLHCQSNCLFSSQQQVTENGDNGTISYSQLQANAVVDRNCYNWRSGIPQGMPSMTRYGSERSDFYGSQRHQMYYAGEGGLLNFIGSPVMKQAKVLNGMESSSHHNLPMASSTRRLTTNNCAFQSLPLMRYGPTIEAFDCEDGIIIQGRGLNYVVQKGCDHLNKHEDGIAHCDSKNIALVSHFGGVPVVTCANGNGSVTNVRKPLLMPQKYNSLLDVQGYIYFLAKDQHGCRFLQQKLDEGNAQDLLIIYNEIIPHVAELMINSFGNYLIQKVLDVCNEEQRTQILLVVTSEPCKLVEISLNMHGTRAVQKLIETLKTREQISLVISALKPRFVDLVKDLNGNHVIQRCLECLTNEDNQFIFYASANFCVDIATHQHGCCVLQRCIAHSSGGHRETLVAKISSNGLLLAQDAFGNYVVQYILELKVPSATANLISQFEGNYVQLSMQKISSNVVEKCLKEFSEYDQSRIIHELLSVPKFEQLLQDPFANYVIQSALKFSKGGIHDLLVKAIRPHESALRTSPYCKRIYSRNFSKK